MTKVMNKLQNRELFLIDDAVLHKSLLQQKVCLAYVYGPCEKVYLKSLVQFLAHFLKVHVPLS